MAEVQPSSSKRWTPVNSCKNQSLTIIFQCGWSGERITVPAQSPSVNNATANNYYDEPSSDDAHINGYTTLQDAIHTIKGKLPALYLMEEQGSASMTCGSNEVSRSDWETTMLCSLIFDQKDESGEVEQVLLKDGRVAFVINIGDVAQTQPRKPTVVTRCLAKHDTYG